MTAFRFPAGFLWGTATSAYQIEGGWDADGKGLSIWDTFSARSGKIDGNHHGQVACNTYNDFETDIAIMQQLGIGAYRFSVSWPRVLPDGRGPANAAGLAYYDRLVDALLKAGITPFVTLFHWDLPHALQESMRGFESRDCAFHFADYAELMARTLGDRVRNWITLNEPWVHATLGYLRGLHAPGRMNPWAYLRVIHHQLLGHGLALERLRALDPAADVGLSLNLAPVYPARDTEGDRQAARLVDQGLNRIFLDSLFLGRYPEPLWSRLRRFQPEVQPGDLAVISQKIDFLGINYYTRTRVRRAWYIPYIQAWPTEGLGAPAQHLLRRGARYTNMGWEVFPEGLFALLTGIRRDYGDVPIYITENGAAFSDEVRDGRVHDEQRQRYLQDHLAQLSRAIDAGVDVRGYFAWSLLDNFEWSYGYHKRFGLVHVDYDTQQRTIKDSGYWYAAFIREASRRAMPPALNSAGTRVSSPASTS
jgi:beta-glucosidase